jgi:hypothetical protein
VSIEQPPKRIDILLDSKDSIILQFKSQLLLPDYCTNNWDSFEECLLDYLDLFDGVVIVEHSPNKSLSKEDQTVYLAILNEAAETGKLEILG